MSRVAAFLLALWALAGAAHAEDPEPLPLTFAASALYWNGGEFKAMRDDAPTIRPSVNPDLLLKGAVDLGLFEHFALGAALLVGIPRDGFRPAVVQATAALRFPFEVSNEVAIVPAAEAGWRMLQEAYDTLGRVQGLALDFDVRLSVDKDLGVVPFCEFGFLSQPFGGRGGLSLVFSPTMFVGGGLLF